MRGLRFVRRLSQEERKTLRELYRRTKLAGVRTRCQIILLSSQEYTVSEIATLTLFNEDSILYWLERFESKGLEGLADRPRSGRPKKLVNAQFNSLSELLLQGATAHGWQNDIWTAKRVADVIQKNFGIEYSTATVRTILRQRLGWSSQRPIQQEKERNETEIQRWKEYTFPQIVKYAFATGTYIVFIDEAGFMAAPTRRLTYAPRGKTPVVRVTDAHGRISVAGAITISPIRKHLGFRYATLPDNQNFHGNTIVQFMKEICHHIKVPIILIWDGFSIHLSKPVVEFLEQYQRVRIEPFPAYAHELNPVDKAWLYIKYDCLPNYAPRTLSDLRSRLIQELDDLQAKPNVLAWCIQKTGLKII